MEDSKEPGKIRFTGKLEGSISQAPQPASESASQPASQLASCVQYGSGSLDSYMIMSNTILTHMSVQGHHASLVPGLYLI